MLLFTFFRDIKQLLRNFFIGHPFSTIPVHRPAIAGLVVSSEQFSNGKNISYHPYRPGCDE